MKFSNSLEKELKRFYKTSPDMFIASSKYAAKLFITYAVDGRYGPKPPIADGFLRGSFSIFANDKYVPNKFLKRPPSGKGEVRVKTSDQSTKGPNVLWVSNMPYASRMENGEWTPGERSTADGNVGPKFFATALQKGAEDYGSFVALRMKKAMDDQGRNLGD